MRCVWLAILAAVILLSVPARAAQEPHKATLTKLDAAVYLASEFDAATTYHLLRDCGSRCYEANPMVRPFARNPSIFVMAGASAYGVNYFAHRLESGSHRRWAMALRIIAIGIHTFAGAHAMTAEY